MTKSIKRGATESGWDNVSWSALVLVCEKCGKRSDRKGLRSDLKAGLKAASGHRRVKVVETGCLGICPKRGIAMTTAEGLSRRSVFVLGDDAAIGVAITALTEAA